MDNVRFPEFIRSLEDTKYPFIPTASLSNGQVSFLEGTFLDAHIYSVAGSGRYYISQAVVQSDSVTLYIGDASDPFRLSGEIALPSSSASVQLKDAYGRPGGILVSEPDRLALMSAWGLGTHRFSLNQTEFCVTCQMPIPDPGVSGFRLPTGEILSGSVWFIGEDGVVLRPEPSTDKNGNPILLLRVDVVGDPLYLQRLCESEDLFTPVRAVRFLRITDGNYSYLCTPDAYGNFNLQMNDALAADAALRIRTTTEGIVFEVEGSAVTND
jgi:hypothetical protein